jgi:hypothetical protein
MERIAGFDFFSLTYDDEGKPTSPQELEQLITHAERAAATDAVLIAHGFRNDIQDASALYTRFLTTLRAHLSDPRLSTALGGRRFVVGGVYWPSKAFSETFGDGRTGTRSLGGEETVRAEILAALEDLKKNDAGPKQRRNLDKAMALVPALEGDRRAQDRFVKLVLSLLDEDALGEGEGVAELKAQRGSDLLARVAETERIDVDRPRGVEDLFGSILGRVGQLLNVTTWYLMKQRSGTVGAAGVADAVRALASRLPNVKRHLVGHSLGARLMAACAKALCADPKIRPDSVLLLEAAFSHYGFSADNGKGTPGFFRDVIDHQIVKGPFLSTFSAEDTVVGKAYAFASRVAGDRSRELGDASDPFGGIGRNGSQRTPEAVTGRLQAPGGSYTFAPGVLTNLDGSGGLIKDHGDVTNEAVTYAFASAVALT